LFFEVFKIEGFVWGGGDEDVDAAALLDMLANLKKKFTLLYWLCLPKNSQKGCFSVMIYFKHFCFQLPFIYH